MNIDPVKARDELVNSIGDRWGQVDWDLNYPWWKKPAKVRILMYADGSVQFKGGPFLGLQYVINLLQSRSYPYVDFDIDTAHRSGTDPSATIPGAKLLTDLDIQNRYDQIWFFSISSTPSLTPAEVAALNTFMSAPKFGGVLVTGDHANLGLGIAGQVPRAGKMRRYPAPDSIPPGWNTTLEEGPDPGTTFDFNDQSDDKPQVLRLKQYPLFSFGPKRRSRPHQVMCGPKGPINLMPDHQHEGEAIAPAVAPGDPTWPKKNGYQEQPEVIAWGRIKDPAATRFGQEIGVVSAYNGHNVNVGRILADSTWHHWFDINLTGIAPPPSPYAGFDDTAAGQEALTVIDAYYLNCGVWLAPPSLQKKMRNFGWWSIVWSDRFAELTPDLPIEFLGGHALDVLGRWAPWCTIIQWCFDDPIFKEKIPQWEWPQWFEKLTIVEPPIERYVAGGVIRQLLLDVGPGNPKAKFPEKAPEDEVLERSIQAGAQTGLRSMVEQLSVEMDTLNQVRDKLL